MTKSLEKIVKEEIILLEKKDVKKITGWGQNVVDYIFKNDEDFPAIKIGKKISSRIKCIKKNILAVEDKKINSNNKRIVV